MIRAGLPRALPALRLDAEFDRRPLAAERPEAVAQPVVPPVGGGPDADRGRPHEAAAYRQPVADLRREPCAVGASAGRQPRHRLAAPQRLGAARRLTAPGRRHPRRQPQRRRVVAQRHRRAPLPESLGLMHQQHPHPHVHRQPGRRVRHDHAGARRGQAGRRPELAQDIERQLALHARPHLPAGDAALDAHRARRRHPRLDALDHVQRRRPSKPPHQGPRQRVTILDGPLQ